MITKRELKTKWWHRLANVLIGLITIVVFIVLFWNERVKCQNRIIFLLSEPSVKMSYEEMRDTYCDPFFIEHFFSITFTIVLFLFMMIFYRKIVLYVSHGGIVKEDTD